MAAARQTTPQPEYFVFHWGTQKNYPFKDKFVIGRTEGDFRVEQDNMMSPQHCRIIMTKDGILCEDLGSEHGTWVNDEQMEPGESAILTAGTRIIVGRQTFSLIIKGPNSDEEPPKKWKRLKTSSKVQTPDPAPAPSRLGSLFRRKPKDFVVEYASDSPRGSGWTMRLILMGLTAFATHMIDKRGWPDIKLPAFLHVRSTSTGTGKIPSLGDLIVRRNTINADCYRLVEEIRAGRKPNAEAIYQIELRHLPDLQDLRREAALLGASVDAGAVKGQILEHITELQSRKMKALATYLDKHSKDDLNEMVRLEKEIANTEPALTAQ